MMPKSRSERPVIRVSQEDMDKFLMSNFHKPRLDPAHSIVDTEYALRIRRMFADGDWIMVGEEEYELAA